ncbi:glycosyltransferase family 4 protein [Marinobacter sp. SS13-12]|uniref:glycosyltransferase family 4 protein n=1 Tax=Marinobacter sp. SS13-12 TaxID=3050451 RepID=UPI0025561260|nr:glycosyltransferase family 4 protein [Marinobacter sp. SS13-12]MDK8464262.1 glycosyltransferase family 4 protein [Marinobacter sp. SS13-12]
MSTLKIGHAARQYPEVRNIIGCVEGASYHLCRDYYSLLRRFGPLLGVDPSSDRLSDLQFQFRDFGLNRVDCLHLFNGVNYSRTPWITTYETLVPRFRFALKNHLSDSETIRSSPATRQAVEQLASDRCIGLIALSDSARQLQSRFLGHFPEFKDDIERKTTVLHPPQQPLVDVGAELTFPYESDGVITFMLVGHEFFRKGGSEVIGALSEARRRSGVDMRLTIISRLKPDSYATATNEEDVVRIGAMLEDNKEWIEYYQSLPYSEVLGKMRSCDVGLLPSYAETYGYSVLEFQACGRPVITTDIRAFPEINSDDRGWLIPVDKKPIGGEAYLRDPERRAALSQAIRKGLTDIFQDILENPEQIKRKGHQALSKIQSFHDPRRFGERLRSIYESGV